ncbi:MAG: RNA pyrophosphohydrolase [Kordiimonadales bacterium]|nr:MAG: RNA pyrophosphohydrolase [Kordiimonadales bacterium]
MNNMSYRPCVGIMLINSNGLIFSAERTDMPGAWQMPQGGVDIGEDQEQAALRELEEETSVPHSAVRIVKRTASSVRYDFPQELLTRDGWKGKYIGQEQHWFLMELTGVEALINIETEHPEFSRWKWSTPEELVSEIVSFKTSVYEQVVAELLG